LEAKTMHIESSITAVSWIPDGSVTGLARLPFSLGVTHYDARPPARLDADSLGSFGERVREVNRLEAWIEVRNGRIADGGYRGPGGFVGSTRLELGFTRVDVPGRARPVLRRRPLIAARSARFIQTIGGRTGMPFPRLTARPPFLAWNSSTAWTTLVLTLYADGHRDGWLLGASPFPRHSLYDADGNLVGETTQTDFDAWFSSYYGRRTPWGGTDLEPMAVRELAAAGVAEVA
jgi:hypothetical protein